MRIRELKDEINLIKRELQLMRDLVAGIEGAINPIVEDALLTSAKHKVGDKMIEGGVEWCVYSVKVHSGLLKYTLINKGGNFKIKQSSYLSVEYSAHTEKDLDDMKDKSDFIKKHFK